MGLIGSKRKKRPTRSSYVSLGMGNEGAGLLPPAEGRRNRWGYQRAVRERSGTSKSSGLGWHLGQIRIMLATRSPSTRCTSQPVRTAASTLGSLRSQYQQRPLPVEQMACNASCTSSTIRPGVLTALKLTSCVRIADSRRLTANTQSFLPTSNCRL